MGADRTQADIPLAGILIPDTRAELHRATSTNLDEADPYPGIVTEGRSTKLQITPTGTPEDEDTLELITLKGGYPEAGGASYAWRVSGGSDYFGCDVPTVITHSESLADDWYTGTNRGRRHPDIVALSDGTLVCCADFPNITNNNRRVVVKTRDTAGTWSAWDTIHTEAATGAAADFFLFPRLVLMPDGTIELFHFTHDRANNETQIKRIISRDDGANWSTDRTAVLDEDIDASAYEPVAMSVAYNNGQHYILTLQDDGANILPIAYASRDMGYRFTDAAAPDNGAASTPYADVIAAGGYFVAVTTTGAGTQFHRLGGAFGAWAEVQTMAIVDATHTLVLADSGRIYLFSDSHTFWSDDYGATWYRPIFGFWWPYITMGGTADPTHVNGTWSRGRAVLVHNSTGATGPTSFHCTQIGGQSTVTMPTLKLALQDQDYIVWEETWVAFDDVDTVTNATANHAGAPTITVADGYQRSNAGLAGRARWDDVGIVGTSMEAFCRIVMSANTGTSRLILRSADAVGPDGWAILIELTTTLLAAYDDVAGGAALGSVVTVQDQELDILVAVHNGTTTNNDGEATVWYRTRSNLESREYTQLATTATLQNGAGTIGGNVPAIRYQVDAVGIGDLYEFYWWLPDSFSTMVYTPWSYAYNNSDDLRGIEYSASRATYVHDGIGILASGYGRTGDTYEIEPAHTYSADKVLPHVLPSRLQGWRSATTTAAMALSFEVAAADSHIGGDMFAAHFEGINFAIVKVEFYIALAWVDQGNFVLGEQMYFDVAGDTAFPVTSGAGDASNVYVQRNELAGGALLWLTPTPANRPILRNTEGSLELGGAINEKRPVIWFGEYTGTEPAASVGEISYPRGTIIIHLNGANHIQRVRFTIDPTSVLPSPTEGYWKIDSLSFGHVAVMGWAPDQTRATARDLSGDELINQRDGSTVRDLVAPQYRQAEFGWARIGRLTEFQNLGDPDYITGSDHASAEPVASRYDSPLLFEGLLAEVGRTPVVYLPRIDRGDGAGTESYRYVTNYANGAVYGRYVPQSYRLETVKGRPAESEYVRTSVITIVEER